MAVHRVSASAAAADGFCQRLMFLISAPIIIKDNATQKIMRIDPHQEGVRFARTPTSAHGVLHVGHGVTCRILTYMRGTRKNLRVALAFTCHCGIF